MSEKIDYGKLPKQLETPEQFTRLLHLPAGTVARMLADRLKRHERFSRTVRQKGSRGLLRLSRRDTAIEWSGCRVADMAKEMLRVPVAAAELAIGYRTRAIRVLEEIYNAISKRKRPPLAQYVLERMYESCGKVNPESWEFDTLALGRLADLGEQVMDLARNLEGLEAVLDVQMTAWELARYEVSDRSPDVSAKNNEVTPSAPGLTENEFKILKELATKKHSMKRADLAAACDISRSVVSDGVKRLQANGLVVRISKRKGCIATDKGREVARETHTEEGWEVLRTHTEKGDGVLQM